MVLYPSVISSHIPALLTLRHLADSPLAQLAKELDLCLFLCGIQKHWDQVPAATMNTCFTVNLYSHTFL